MLQLRRQRDALLLRELADRLVLLVVGLDLFAHAPVVVYGAQSLALLGRLFRLELVLLLQALDATAGGGKQKFKLERSPRGAGVAMRTTQPEVA